MDLYHSRLTPNDLNDLIIKYKIPHDLHPRLPSKDFVMSELLDDAVGPLGLNKVITFEVLCQSLQIEPTVTLFRVFQTLCKQGDWFSFAKRRAPCPAIPDAMVWRHPNASIDDPRPAAGSFNMADMRCLSAHVIKLMDMPKGADGNVMGIHDFLCLPKWTGTEAVILDPTPEDLAVGTPSFKIVAKAEASQKRKASTFGAASSHVAKRTRSALAQSSSSTTRLSLFVGDNDESDDDDAYVEIPLVTPLRFVAVIPSSGNQGGSSVAPTAEGSNTRDSQGKGIMVDDAAAPSSGVSRPRPSSGSAPLFKDVSGDAMHTDLFPFSIGPYYATYPEGGVAGNCEFTSEEWDAPYWPTLGVLTKEVFKDHVISVLHCMMMSHGGELLALYRGLNQSHHEYVLLADSMLKGYKEKVANMIGLELQVAALMKQVSGLNDKLTSFDASFSKSKAKGKEWKKKIKSLGKSLDNLHAEVARLSAPLNQATILEAERDDEILRLKATPLDFSSFFWGPIPGFGLEDEFAAVLKKMVNFMPGAHDRLAEASLLLEPEKLVRLANVPIPRGTRVSPTI
ncbi:hypothetical protein Tco_0962480, partial [Tanacetum coccineum]